MTHAQNAGFGNSIQCVLRPRACRSEPAARVMALWQRRMRVTTRHAPRPCGRCTECSVPCTTALQLYVYTYMYIRTSAHPHAHAPPCRHRRHTPHAKHMCVRIFEGPGVRRGTFTGLPGGRAPPEPKDPQTTNPRRNGNGNGVVHQRPDRG
eukprot:scaffold2664_cov117-Isochrysis_galbana.AAC.2